MNDSKVWGFFFRRKYLLKRRQDMMDNDGFIDIQILLADDFHIQQTICLTDLVCDNPVEFLQNKRSLRYIQAQHSEIFHVFARRLAHAMVGIKQLLSFDNLSFASI